MTPEQLRFLIVEDHAIQSMALNKLLTSLGASAVYSASEGQAAGFVIDDPDRPVDVVILDLEMPGMDGMAFIRNLSERGSKVAVILASTLEPKLLEATVVMAQAYSVRVLGAIEKPVTASKLAPLLARFREPDPDAVAHETPHFSKAAISEAWAANEFVAHFDPRIDVNSGAIVGAKVTPHWISEAYGSLPSSEFASSVNAYGLADDMTWRMLQSGLGELRQWQGDDRPFTLSINLSASMLRDMALVSRLDTLVDRAAVNPRWLVLRIGEGIAEGLMARELENLVRLRVHHYQLAIDEFGSSRMLQEHLARISFNELHISSRFVNGNGDGNGNEGPDSAGLAVALEMADRMKLSTVADGVNSAASLALLKDWQCSYAHGPFFSKPVDAQQMSIWAQAPVRLL